MASSASSSRPPPATSDDRSLGQAGALARLGHDLRQHRVRALRRVEEPRSTTALPDLIASAAASTVTFGRAS